MHLFMTHLLKQLIKDNIMDKGQAFDIIEKALNIANTKGAFVLRDATVIMHALDTLREDYPTPVDEDKPDVEPEKN
jgi:hypothetical protein